MRNFINRIITKIKKEEFILDSHIPYSYLFYFFLSKFRDLFYGSCLFRTTKRVFIHPSSTIKCKSKITFDKNLNIARGCYIDALSKEGLIIGKNVSIGKYTHIECTGSLKFLGKGIVIGNNVGLGTHGHYGGAAGLIIGSDTIIGNYVSFHPESHKYSNLEIPIRMQGVSHQGIMIGKNCWIGSKATFLDGAIVGDGCIVAASAVVKGIFPENCIIGGIPAKILKYRN